MVVKVQEPQPDECAMLREGQILFTYLHLAADIALTDALVTSGATYVAYETVTDQNGGLPNTIERSRWADDYTGWRFPLFGGKGTGWHRRASLWYAPAF